MSAAEISIVALVCGSASSGSGFDCALRFAAVCIAGDSSPGSIVGGCGVGNVVAVLPVLFDDGSSLTTVSEHALIIRQGSIRRRL